MTGLILYVLPGNIAVLLDDPMGIPCPTGDSVNPCGLSPMGVPQRYVMAAPQYEFPLAEHVYIGDGEPLRVWLPAGMPRPPAAWVRASVEAMRFKSPGKPS